MPRQNMETWALANQKGGTGKTTCAIHLAAALAGQGKRCLLIDLDPQAHATLGLGVAVEDERSIASTFLEGTPLGELIRATRSGFHLVPSDARLAEFEEVAERSLRPESILEEELATLTTRYDWVVLDCPPRADGVITTNAIRAADTTLLVVETGAFALQGALRAREIFQSNALELDATAAERAKPFKLRLVATMFEQESQISREFLIALQARFGAVMLDTVIRRDEVLRASVAYGIPAHELAPDSRAALDFEALAQEILQPGESQLSAPAGAAASVLTTHSATTLSAAAHPMSDSDSDHVPHVPPVARLSPNA